MRSANEAIPAHLRLLGNYGDMIAEAYAGGNVSVRPDNRREINVLLQAGVLLDADDHYKVTRHLKRHFDTVLRRRRNYAVGENVRAQIESLENLARECEHAGREGNVDRQNEFADDFADTVILIHQDIDDTLSHLRALVDTEFGDVAAFSEKGRQNDHYLRRVEQTVDTFTLIEEADVVDMLRDNPLLADQQRIYRRQLTAHLAAWRASFLDIADVLREHVHALRRVEPKARTLRRLAFHLQRDRGYEPPEAPADTEQLHDWMRAIEGITIAPSPHVHDSTQEDILQQIAVAIPPETTRIRKVRSAGALEQDAFDAPDEVAMETTRWRAAYDEMIASVQDQVVSSRQWYFDRKMDIGIDLWLLYVQAVASANDEDWSYRMDVLLEPHDHRDGLLWIEDVTLCSRH